MGQGASRRLSGKECACSAGDPGLIPRSGRSPGGGHGNTLQDSCLENPLERGAWWAACSPQGPKALDTTKRLNSHSNKDGAESKVV